jgi:hypothetical protein
MTVYIGVDFHARQQTISYFKNRLGSGLRFFRFSVGQARLLFCRSDKNRKNRRPDPDLLFFTLCTQLNDPPWNYDKAR